MPLPVAISARRVNELLILRLVLGGKAREAIADVSLAAVGGA